MANIRHLSPLYLIFSFSKALEMACKIADSLQPIVESIDCELDENQSEESLSRVWIWKRNEP